MEHIPITHAPQGAREPHFLQERQRSRPQLPCPGNPPDDAPASPLPASPPPAFRVRHDDRTGRAGAMLPTALPATGRHLLEPAAHGPPCHKKRPPSQGRRSSYPNGLFLSHQRSALVPAIAIPIRPGTEAIYFFRASESTMAWAWASSTFPASRTSTCRSAPRASTPRMGMFPACPCIS